MGWSVDDVMPGNDGPENLRSLKKSQLKVDIGPCRQTIEFSANELSFLPFQVPTSEDELRSKTPRDVPMVGGVVSIV